jgi:ABC-2 type transport system permease protein
MNFKGNLTAYLTLLRRETIRIFRVWRQALLPPIITTALYFIIFGSFIGSRVGQVKDVSYMAFVVPGLVLMPNIINSYMNVTATVYLAKFQGSMEEILTSPMSELAVIMAYVTAGMIRGIFTSIIVLLISLLFMPLSIGHVFVALIFLVMTSLLFSLAGFVNGIFANSFDDIATVPTFILMPLTFLGGVFYPISTLPGFWQVVSRFNPVLYMIEGFRYGFLGTAETNIWTGLLLLVVCSIAFLIADILLMKKGVRIKE